jgi:hypothetical protein
MGPPQSALDGRGVNFAALFPGGEAPGAEEIAVAGIILGALAFVILMRRGFSAVLSK